MTVNNQRLTPSFSCSAEQLAAAVLAERERCAAIADECAESGEDGEIFIAAQIAKRIREGIEDDGQ